ncbi:MAG TPA: SLC13 family permease [Erysipelotrichaceae bacterium]|nr:SLC13 family permease [Erysipelotrichaceae bacterium]
MNQIIVFIVILAMLVLFIDGRIRYEFVSLSALLILTVFKIIDFESAFSGFSHPAVITVASVLVISASLVKSGVVERLVVLLNNKTQNLYFKLLALMLVTGVLSAFMNNVGALALILPIALRMAKDGDIPPSQLLMPVAFSSLMGGMITIIGTPPNLIVSNYRLQVSGMAFSFFEFAPIGLAIMTLGILFTVFLGGFLIPKRKTNMDDGIFNIGEYLSEVKVEKDSKVNGQRILDFKKIYKIDVEVLSILRDKRHIIIPKPHALLKEGDVLIIKTDSLHLNELINRTGLSLKGASLDFLESTPYLSSKDFELIEVVLRDDSLLIGRTAFEISLRNRFNVNLIAVSRQGSVSIERLKSFRFKSGDILLLQAPKSKLQDIFKALSCLPLAERKVQIKTKGSKSKEFLPLSFFLVAILLTTLGIMPVQVAFSSVAVLLVLTKQISAREFYDSIEWPTILLLGSLLPLGLALQNSGASDTLASLLANLSTYVSPVFMLVIVMIITIFFTNLISSTATAVLMGPVAISLAQTMSVNTDPFLIAVAIGATTAFITPIAHQSNMLVMGPGGYKFSDYWKLGLPLSIISIVVSVPIIIKIWPL